MKWMCGRRNNQTAAWAAVAACLISTQHSMRDGHHLDGWWFAGLGAGVVVGVGIGLWRRRRCV